MIRPLCVALACAILAPSAGFGQEPAPSSPDRIEGRLLLVDEPPDSGTVVLHGVNPEEAGPLDSLRVDADGRFSFDLTGMPQIGGGQSLFVSHRRDGILYFGPPLFRPEEVPEEYVIRAFPTQVVPAEGLELVVEIRNIVIDEGPGVWRVTDIIQVHNEARVTWVPSEPGEVVWRYPLPPGATSFRLMEGGPGSEEVRFEDATLLVSGAFPPGDRLLVIQYDLASLETSIPLTGRTDGVEFLVREPAPPLIVDGLRADAPIEMERGSSYMRWWAEDLEDRVVRVRIGEEGELPTAWLAVGVALLLVLLGAVLVHRGGARPTDPAVGQGAADPARRRRDIMLAIAKIDEEVGAGDGGESDEARRKRRAVLLGELARLERGGDDRR